MPQDRAFLPRIGIGVIVHFADPARRLVGVFAIGMCGVPLFE